MYTIWLYDLILNNCVRKKTQWELHDNTQKSNIKKSCQQQNVMQIDFNWHFLLIFIFFITQYPYILCITDWFVFLQALFIFVRAAAAVCKKIIYKTFIVKCYIPYLVYILRRWFSWSRIIKWCQIKSPWSDSFIFIFRIFYAYTYTKIRQNNL